MTTLTRSSAEAAAGDRLPGVLGRPYRMLTVGIVSCVLLIAFEAMAVNTAMPVAARALHGLGLYAFAFSGYFTASLLAMVVSGEWCDKRGPLAPLGLGIGLFGAGLVIAGTAQNMWSFVGGRAVQGLGGGMVIVALYVVAGRAYPERLRAKVFSAFSAAWVLPSIVGPLVSGAVAENLGWRWVFLSIPVLVVLPLGLMLPQLRTLEPESEPTWALDRRRLRLALGLALGAGLLQYAGQRLDLLALLPAAAGVALAAPTAVRLLPPGTFRARRGLPTVVLLRGIAAGAFFTAEAFIPLMLVSQRGLSPTLAGLSLTSGALSWALGSYLQGRGWAESRRPLLIRGGFLACALAVVAASAALLPWVPTWLVAVGWACGGIGMGMMFASIGVLTLNLSTPEDTGANSASLQVSDALGNVALTLVAGILFSSLGHGAGGFAAIFWTMAAVAVLGSLVAGRITRTSGTTLGS